MTLQQNTQTKSDTVLNIQKQSAAEEPSRYFPQKLVENKNRAKRSVILTYVYIGQTHDAS